jgi:hypothetical protein
MGYKELDVLDKIYREVTKSSEVYDFSLGLTYSMKMSPMFYFYSFCKSGIETAALAGSAFCQNIMDELFCRVYLKNNEGVDIDIDFSILQSRNPTTLESGKTYAMHPKTAEFFTEKALEQGYTLTVVDQTEWLATGSLEEFGS